MSQVVLKEYKRLDAKLRIMLDGLADQCDKGQWWNAIHRLIGIQREILVRLRAAMRETGGGGS